MHPAPSVIVFTALSGLGFGLLFFLGLDLPMVRGTTQFVFFFLAFALAIGGLVSSTFHLGNPQRALKAFSQWRTSWLSREGVASVVTLCVMGLYAAARIFLNLEIPVLGLLGSVLCLVTVICTAMIYGQMKTVPRWNQTTTPFLFLLYTLAGGALLAAQIQLAALLIAALTLVQAIVWWTGDAKFKAAGSTMGTATGLGNLGTVRLLESPHSGPNYLMTEMVHVIGRKHSQKLRIIALVTLGLLPALLLWMTPASHASAAIAILLHLVGLFTARWLFFAEAEHVVGLYYGKR